MSRREMKDIIDELKPKKEGSSDEKKTDEKKNPEKK